MLFRYTALDKNGAHKQGVVEALNVDVAITALQRRGLVVSSIDEEKEKKGLLNMNLAFFERVKYKELVILSRQIATLFEANVSALRVFEVLGEEMENPLLGRTLSAIAAALQSGRSISQALSEHPKVFSDFYVNMVKAGEESGKLNETFLYLADYLDRTYEVTAKARSALIYPAFVILTFFGVMSLLLTTVIPKLSEILTESGQDIPIYTKIVLGTSSFLVNYGAFILIALIIGGFFLGRWRRTDEGKLALDRVKLSIPYVGDLFRKLYLSRLADNMHTMLLSGIPMVRSMEATAAVVENRVYEDLLNDAAEKVRTGTSVAEALGRYEEIPRVLIQMVRVGEETGELGHILETLANFYRHEVQNAVDGLVGLIEPAMIVLLGAGVGVVLASVLIPIYNISAGF